jgi:hypothetical protein
MSQQIINVGTAPDDGAGDPLRTAFIKTNQNFTELYATAGITGIANGSSNISIPLANGNVNLSAGGTANVLIIRSAGANVTGTLGVQGLTKLTTLSTTGSIQNAGDYVGVNISATGNIDGGNLNAGTGITGQTLSLSSNVISVLRVTANISGGNISTPGSLSTTGNITTSGSISATGNITTGQFIFGDGGFLSNVTAVSNLAVTQIANGTTSVSIVASGGNATTSVGGIPNVVIVTSTGTITSGTASATGNIIGGNITTGGQVSATGNITGGNLITSGSHAVTGNLSAGNISTPGQISATGNITGGNILGGNAHFAGNISATGVVFTTSTFNGNAVTGTDALFVGVSGFTPLASNVIMQVAGNVNGHSQINFENINNGTLASTDLVVTADNGNDNSYYLDMGIASSNYDNPAFFGDSATKNDAYLYVVGSDSTGPSGSVGNLIVGSTNGIIKLFVGNTAQANVIQQISSTGIAVTGIISASGNITGANVNTTGVVQAGSVTATGNVSAATLVTSGATINNGITTTGNISATGNVNGGNLNISTQIFAVSNINGGNLSSAGNVISVILSATGNVIGGNITTGGLVTATGNVTGGNINTGGVISATGNVTGNYILGNGALLTGVITSVANINLGTSNVTVTSSGGNIAVGVGGTSNVAVFATTGEYVTGVISANGNITGGNITTAGVITVNSGGAATAIVNGAGNAVGNIGSSSNYFNQIFAQATTALYADLAEMYTADAEYEPGTVVVFGGSQEVTVAAQHEDSRVAGVISTNPSYKMNSGLTAEHTATVALTGRVPTKVIGPVQKGSMMVSAPNGYAIACSQPKIGTVIGKSLEEFNGNTGIIEIVVGRV